MSSGAGTSPASLLGTGGGSGSGNSSSNKDNIATNSNLWQPSSSLQARERISHPTSQPSSVTPGSALFSASNARSISPLMSRRTWQLQADEGFATAPYKSSQLALSRSGDSVARTHSHTRPDADPSHATTSDSTRLLDTQDDPPLFESRLFGGRARAGTLPSSWSNKGLDSLTLQADDSRIRSNSNASRIPAFNPIGADSGDPRWSNATGSVPGTPSEQLTMGDFGANAFLSASSANRTSVMGTSSVRPRSLLRQLSPTLDASTSTANIQQPPLPPPPPPPHSPYNSLFSGANGGASFPSANAAAAATAASSSSPSSYEFHANAPSHQSVFGEVRSRSGSNAAAKMSSGLGSNAFGPSIFTSTWSERPLGHASSATDSTASRRSSLLAPASASTSVAAQDVSKSAFINDDFGTNLQRQTAYNDQDGSMAQHTIDYLGLEQDDNTSTISNSARDDGSRLAAGLLQPQRNRASTLAAMPPNALTRMRSHQDAPSSSHRTAAPVKAPPVAEAERTALQDLYNSYPVNQAMSSSGGGGTNTSSGLGNFSAAQGRNRAGTVAGLGGPGGRQRVERELLRMATSGNLSNLSNQEMASLLANLEHLGLGAGAGNDGDISGLSIFKGAPLENFPYLDVSTPPPLSTRQSPFNTGPSTPTGRSNNQRGASSNDESFFFSHTLSAPSHQHQSNSSLTRQASNPNAMQHITSSSSASSLAARGEPHPQQQSTATLNQTPSRSLWIGNLHSGVTGQELMHVFAPYGAIESLRLLPEKECGFVNFVELADAVQAREDVLGRLGAKLDNLGTGLGGTVRIGFGKVDSAPGMGSIGASGMSGMGVSGNALTSLAQNQLDDVEGGAGTNAAANAAGVGANASDANVPTRALWVGSIPTSVTPSTLLSVFQPFGPVESARVLTHKNCGFVNFERVDDAVRARKMLNGREVLGSEVGAMRIGFAKVPTRNVEQYPSNGTDMEQAVDALSSLQGASASHTSTEDQMLSNGANGGGLENYRSNLVINLLNGQHDRDNHQEMQGTKPPPPQQLSQPPQQQQHAQQRNVLGSNTGVRPAGISSSSSIVPASDKGGVPLPAHMLPRAGVTDLQLLMRELSQDSPDVEADVASVSEARPLQTYYITIPLVSEVSSGRRFETGKLRETRRGIELGQYNKAQCDQLALEYIEYIVDLASDYIGNTLVQKFFETCSEERKMDMLRRLAPHLAMVGCHKNGTWAAQKILGCATSPDQIKLIGQHLRPYVPGLLLDSFGNYVVQCCLPWTQHNDFVFDAMVDRCWEIAQGRFGARSMRACLEDNHVTSQQRKRVAIAIILNSVPLATSPNGSILLTWLLDTSGLNKSYRLLAPRFAPHLAHLCTHKLASSTVLRLVTQKSEPDACRLILVALFESDEHEHTLEEIIVDQVHGSQFITKVLASPTLTDEQRKKYAEQVKRLLAKHQLVGVPAYRRLCEDLGLLSSANPSAADSPGLGGGVGGAQHPDSALPQHSLPSTMPSTTVMHPTGSHVSAGHHPMGNAGLSEPARHLPTYVGAGLPPSFMSENTYQHLQHQQAPSRMHDDRAMMYGGGGYDHLGRPLVPQQQQQHISTQQPDMFNAFWPMGLHRHASPNVSYGGGGGGGAAQDGSGQIPLQHRRQP